MPENIKLQPAVAARLQTPATGLTDGVGASPTPTTGEAPFVQRDHALATQDLAQVGHPSIGQLNVGDPVLPDLAGPFTQRAAGASVALDGLAYRQRHLAEAIHILTSLASARMESVGQAKVRYGKSQTTAALEAAQLELKSAQAGRQAAWRQAGAGLMSQVGEVAGPAGRIASGVLGQALTLLDKTFGAQRVVDDARWQRNYIELRDRMSKQLEDMQGNEYDRSVRLLERSLETTRQMATGNTDTIKGVSHNL